MKELFLRGQVRPEECLLDLERDLSVGLVGKIEDHLMSLYDHGHAGLLAVACCFFHIHTKI